MIKKSLLLATFLAAFAATAAQPLYFTNPNGYTVYHPYKWNEIEIAQFRGQPEKPVADWVKKSAYPLIKEGGPNGEKNPYIEIDTNGHKVHKYRRYVYEPREFKKLKKAPETPDAVGTKTYSMADDYGKLPKEVKSKGKPLLVKDGLHRGKRLDKLVIVYEKIGGKWICYDAYWVWSAAVTRDFVPLGLGYRPGMRAISPGR
jgi:hypothetical protein